MSASRGNRLDVQWHHLQSEGDKALRKGNSELALLHFQKALKAAESFDDKDPRGLITMDRLTQLYMHFGNFRMATVCIKRQLLRRIDILGEFNESVLKDLRKLTLLKSLSGEMDEAQKAAMLCVRLENALARSARGTKNAASRASQSTTIATLPLSFDPDFSAELSSICQTDFQTAVHLTPSPR